MKVLSISSGSRGIAGLMECVAARLSDWKMQGITAHLPICSQSPAFDCSHCEEDHPALHAFVSVSVAVLCLTGPAELVLSFVSSLFGNIFSSNWGEYAHAVCASCVGTEASAHTVGFCSLETKIFVSLVSCPS